MTVFSSDVSSFHNYFLEHVVEDLLLPWLQHVLSNMSETAKSSDLLQ